MFYGSQIAVCCLIKKTTTDYIYKINETKKVPVL